MAGHGPSSMFLLHFYDQNLGAADSRGRTLSQMLKWSDSKLESCHDYIQIMFPLPEGSMFSWNTPLITREIMDEFRRRRELRQRLRGSLERMLRFYGFQIKYESDAPTAPPTAGVSQHDTIPAVAAPAESASTADVKSKEPEEVPDEDTSTKKATPEDSGNQEEASEAQTAAEDTTSITSGTATTVPHLPEEQHGTAAPQGPTTTSMIPPIKIVRSPDFATKSRNWNVRMDHNHLRITRILRSLRVLGLEEECKAFFDALETLFKSDDNNIGDNSMKYWRRALENPIHIAPDGDKVSWLEKWAKEQERGTGTK